MREKIISKIFRKEEEKDRNEETKMPPIFFPLAADSYSGGCNEYLSCLLTLFLPKRFTGYSKYLYR